MADKETSIVPDNSEVENLKAQLKEAQEKLGGMSGELETYKDLSSKATLLANVIASSEELQKGIENQYNKMYNPTLVDAGKKSNDEQIKELEKKDTKGMDPQAIESLNREISDLKGGQRDQIIKTWEDRVGMGVLDEEKKSEIRKEISLYMSKFGREFKDIPTKHLEEALGTAYEAVNLKGAIEEAKSEGYAASYTNSSGSMPAMGSRMLNEGTKEVLSPTQKKWAEKFNLDVNKVEKTYSNRDEEQKRVVKAEQKD